MAVTPALPVDFNTPTAHTPGAVSGEPLAVSPALTESLVARALEVHPLGYNCAQCVACALAMPVGVSADLCFRAAEGFGRGMGDTSGTCGALSGAIMMLGLANSAGIDAPVDKAATRGLVCELSERFRTEVGSTVCAAIRGSGTGIHLYSCDDCIALAVRLTVGILASRGLIRPSDEKPCMVGRASF